MTTLGADVHRALGVQLNNSIWSELDAGSIGPDSPLPEREELLYAAYASAYHWRQVGTPINQARAEHLISRTALRVGLVETALLHARRCLELVEDNAGLAEDWDAGFAHEALARALAASGEADRAAVHRERALSIAGTVADPDDRTVLENVIATGESLGPP